MNGVKTIWTEEMNQFLRDNFSTMANRQLADHLGLSLSITRMQTRELGLKRYEFDNWTPEEEQLLIDNYQTLGDIEIIDLLRANRPERVPMRRQAIQRKRRKLNLHRTPEQVESIKARHVQPGGRSYTIHQNSGSANLNDKMVAQYLATGTGHQVNQELKQELLNHPELLQVKRMQLQLDRSIRKGNNK